MQVDNVEDTEMTEDEKMTVGEIEKEREAAIDFGAFMRIQNLPNFTEWNIGLRAWAKDI